MRNWLIICGALAVITLVVAITRQGGDTSTQNPAHTLATTSAPALPPVPVKHAVARGREDFVGSAACTACHQQQSEAYLGSHHQKALVTPNSEAVKAHFDGTHFDSRLGGTTKFSVRDGTPFVSTPMPAGKTAAFPISYVSGVWPLEQYVVATARGKLQSLGAVWDSRASEAGGGKWFHAYGPSGIAPSDTLFFTEPAQNWNHVCADCHSTLVERRYDPKADSFDTRWAELSVGCEACHGPGAQHIEAAKNGETDPAASLAVLLKPSQPWGPSVTGSPTPRPQDGVEVESCAPCHSRRTPIKEGFIAADPFLDSFVPDLLEPGRYHADGQVEGEVYEWGSFTQSRMYQSGVKCSDCHNPHSGKTYASGNALCGRCHEPTRFDVETHSHHVGAKAPLCIDCHMPPTTFMQIDERRDHSIRIPRPDHSVEFGTPNSCNGCHEEKSAAWANEWVSKWAPSLHERKHFVAALSSDRHGTLDAPHALRTLVKDVAAPAIARATALERLGSYPAAMTVDALRTALGSAESLVVYGAVLGAAELPLAQRAPLLLSVLEHELRAVRIAAGKALAGVPLAQLPKDKRSALERVFVEVEQSFDVSASWAETQVERSAFELARGKFTEAETAVQTALRIQPCHVEAYLNLADLERQRGNEAAAQGAIRAALACNPQYAAAHHALGLWQVRARQSKTAITSLRKAVELAPTDPRFSYVLAVAVAGNGDRDEAIRILEATLKNRPNDANTLQALAGYLRAAGELERAEQTRRQLDALLR